MIIEITKSYRYDPESIEEGERIYKEAISKIILQEIQNKSELKTVG